MSLTPIQMHMKSLWSVIPVGLALTFIGTASVLAGPTLSTVSISPQTPALVAPGGSANYTVTVTVTGTGNLDAYLVVSGLPAGATASFSPSKLTFSGSTPSTQTANLTISTTSSIPMGVYSFTLVANDGSSHNQQVTTGTLKVGVGIAGIETISGEGVEVTVCGYPGQNYQLQATLTMQPPTWVTLCTNAVGTDTMFSYLDRDATNYPSRFYRLLPN